MKQRIVLLVVVAGFVLVSGSWSWANPPTATNDRWPHYSPDGTRIVFVSNRGGTFSPFIMRADGSGLKAVPVTLEGGRQFGGVVWYSNDKLLFSEVESIRFGGYDDGGEIATFVRASIDDGDSQTLFAGINTERPAVSPSGDSLVFEAEHGAFQSNPTIDIETLELSTLAVNVLTHHDGTNVQAAWSPDGTSIAYACATGNNALQICTMRSDGTGSRILTSGAGSHQWPAWSPDAKHIAYFNESKVQGKTDSVIAVVDTDGGGDHVITSHPGVVRDETPSWSPDGCFIAFQTDRMGGTFRIAIIHPDGTGFQVLTR
jgi:Tol biopolymer transport system component